MRHEQPITDRGEALKAWHRVYGEDGETPQLESLARRLAVGLVLDSELRRFLQDAAVGKLPPAARFADELTDVTVRVRVTPLIYLAEHDTHVAEFLVRHPAAIQWLLDEQGEVFGDRSDESLTRRAQMDVPGFLRKMKIIAPLLLERAELDRRNVEAFLRYLHRKDVLDRLIAAKSVRSELGSVLVGFCREHGLGNEQMIPEYTSSAVIDNILWQVAADIVTQSETREGRQVAEAVGRALQAERVSGCHGRDPEEPIRYALAGCVPRISAETVHRVESVLRREFKALSNEPYVRFE
jgi:hypothetical protein